MKCSGEGLQGHPTAPRTAKEEDEDAYEDEYDDEYEDEEDTPKAPREPSFGGAAIEAVMRGIVAAFVLIIVVPLAALSAYFGSSGAIALAWVVILAAGVWILWPVFSYLMSDGAPTRDA